MNPIDELYETLKKKKKHGIAVISTEFVMRKIREQRKIDSQASDSLIETS